MKLRIFSKAAFMAATFMGGMTLSVVAHAQIMDMPAMVMNTVPDTEDGTKTPDITVAMVYYKLSGRAPDYNTWAMQTETYKQAPDLQKSTVLDHEISSLRSVFSLTTLSEPIVVQQQVKLSEYSPKNGGFSIEDFKDDTFFGYSFGGMNYAVVVPDLANYQWQPVDIDPAGVIDLAAQKTDRYLLATLYIRPTSADTRAALPLGDKNYWLISGELQRLTLSAPGRSKPLLERVIGGSTVDAKPNEELLKLYQNQK